MTRLILTPKGKRLAKRELSEAIHDLETVLEHINTGVDLGTKKMHLVNALMLLERVRVAVVIDWSEWQHDETVVLIDDEELPF